MTQGGPLRWRTGLGWLVIGGGGAWREGETGEVDAAALGWADLTRPIAVLPTAGLSTAEGEALLDYYIELGGPNGSLVPIFSSGDAQREDYGAQLAEAGLIVITDGPSALSIARALREQPAVEALGRAFDAGAAVVGIGAGGAALGAWVAGAEGATTAEQGLAWLEDVVIEPHFQGTESAGGVRSLLHEHPECLGMGVPRGAALALGPGGEVVTVGPTQVTVVVAEKEGKAR